MTDTRKAEPQPEREATDQPPPIHGPLTQAQIISLVVPLVSFLVLAALLLWGTLSNVQPNAATPTLAPPSATPTGAALVVPPTVTVQAALATATIAPTDTTVAADTSATATAQVIAALPPNPPTATAETAPSPTEAPTAAPSDSPTVAADLVTPTVRPPTPAPGSPVLAGRRIGLDPGHGPRKDLGAVLVDRDTGKLILAEDELNLDVARRARDLLQALGATVVMTRDSKDQFSAPWPPDTNGDGIKNGAADDLQERIDILNAGKVEVFLSIHANSSANPAKRQGIQAVYCASDDCATPTQNKRLGKLVLDHLEATMATVGVPVTARELRNDVWADSPGEVPGHLFMTGPAEPPRHPRALAMPGVTVESFYVTSPPEAEQLLQDRVRQAIAQSYADALVEFLTTQP
jgi:N-acetylmuramoyl-L-alanine amidase